MRHITPKYWFMTVLFISSTVARAETVYITDQFNIGLHQDWTAGSPIMKLIPSGTALSVIEHADELVHVQEPSGLRGWINRRYIMTTKPNPARIKELEDRNKALQKKMDQLTINDLKNDRIKTMAELAVDAAPDTQKKLEQQLNSERLKVGKLQAQLTDLKARLSNIDDSDRLLDDTEQLKQKNRQLALQLKGYGIEVAADNTVISDSILTIDDWKQMLFLFAVVFILGMAVGTFVLDCFNRYRHGGFRI